MADAAWIHPELTKPAPEGAVRADIDAGKVYDLLAIVRRARPQLECGFDARRVAMWDLHLGARRPEHRQGFPLRGCVIVLIMLMIPIVVTVAALLLAPGSH